MSNLSQFISGASLPAGATMAMPALAAAGTQQYVTASNELYVNNATAAVVPQASCNPTVVSALGGTNDVIMSSTQTSLLNFQMAANVPASGYFAGLITSANQMSTKGFYVAGTYYFFSPNDLQNTIGWISTPDLVNYTPLVQIIPLSGMMIVDIFYNAANSTWYFLEANGAIFSTTNLTTLANATFYSLPSVPQASAYVRLTLINSVWYAVGGSGANGSSGYRISSSTNLLTWTIVTDVPAPSPLTGPATNIVQGAGTGATTEILVSTASNYILTSTNNGTSFTKSAGTAAVTSAVINNIFYSTRTGLYYIAATVSGSALSTYVSTTNTLATATWTQFSSGFIPLANTASTYAYNVTIVDTGTWVGPVFTDTYQITYFYYGANYNTQSTALMTAAQLNFVQGGVASYVQGAKAMWLNNTLILAYSSMPDSEYGYQRINAMLISATGPTCSTGIAVGYYAPISYLAGSVPLQYNSWSGAIYFGGSYYAGQGAMALAAAGNFYYLAMYLFKINAILTTFSCPVAPVLSTFIGSYSYYYCYALSAPQINSSGTGLYWSGYMNSNYVAPAAAYTYEYMSLYAFNGTTLTATVINLPAGIGDNSEVNACGPSLAGQPGSNVAMPKWSSLQNAYVTAFPASGDGESLCIGTMPSIGSSSPTALFTLPNTASQVDTFVAVDVMSTGGVVACVSNANTSLNIYTIFGSTVTQLPTPNQAPVPSTYGGLPNNFGIWEVVYNGTSYLAFAFSNASALQYLNIYKLSATSGPVLVLANFPIPTLSLPPTITSNLRRVFSYNGAFYLGDAQSSSPQTTRNALMLTPNNGSFTVTPAHLQLGGDGCYAGLPNTYTTMNTITTVNPVGVPAAFIAQITGGNGSFTKVR